MDATVRPIETEDGDAQVCVANGHVSAHDDGVALSISEGHVVQSVVPTLSSQLPLPPLNLGDDIRRPPIDRPQSSPPREVLRRLGPGAARLSAVVIRRAASFHKKVLKASALNTSTESQLKLGTFERDDVSSLISLARFVVVVGPLLQVIWSVFIEPDRPEAASLHDIDFAISDAAEATIQLLIMITACLFTRRTLMYRKRQGVQVVLAAVISVAGIIAAVTFTSDMLKSTRRTSVNGRKLLSFSNALLATSIYLTMGYLTDYYAETILSSKEAFSHAKQQRLLDRSRRLAFVLYVFSGIYFAFRVALTWRSDVVFDFIPMANIITMIRVEHVEGKDAVEPHVTLDSFVMSIADAVLLSLSFAKCYFTHQLFDRIFLIDFARVYTEYRVFVVNFCTTIMMITLSGHVAAWTVPFYHIIDPSQLFLQQQRIGNVGSVQMQLGFRLSLALWFVCAAYCALPADTKGIRGWFVGSKDSRSATSNRIKYFLYESDVHLKAGYRNLARAGNIDPRRFILENQVEAFNFAQLVYARGNARYDQELDGLQHLIGDPSFTIIEAVHDAVTDTHCLILESETQIVVAFRGTSSKKNAQTDLQSSMTVHAGAKEVDLHLLPATVQSRPNSIEVEIRTIWHRLQCKKNDPRVHSGFLAAYQSVAGVVLSRVSSAHRSDARPILVTGHSLGGALAALCSFDIVTQLKITDTTCTTFGCPRIGNHAFQKRYAHAVPATFAFVNASDMITKLPPKTPKAQSYASVGTIVLINAYGNLVIDPNVLELGVMHRGYSPKAHTMRAYHLSLLMWCLRAHQTKYHPKFWRQSLAFLQAEYGHLPEVREYLKKSAVVNTQLQPSQLHLDLTGDAADQSASLLRQVVRRLEAALREEREDQEDEVISVSIISNISRWLCRSQQCEWFSTNDAIRVLKSQLNLENDATAVDLGQTLTVHGLLKPEAIVFSRNARFCFPVLNEDDAENNDEWK